MAAGLSIKLRCASWQQLATIYRRDLSRGAMFLKASTQPSLGTAVRIDLELPSATVIELNGVIEKHVVDAQRGAGVELKLEPLPTKTVWLIESALAAETKVRAQSQGGAAPSPASTSGPQTAISDGQEVAAAEQDLIRALEAECDSLRRLNPFLVLGIGYETTDADVRAAFGELTKRYHPDRFARYQSPQLRGLAAEIFILIRDAYRKLADPEGRAQVIASIGAKTPVRPQTPVRGTPIPAGQTGQTGKTPPPVPRVSVPPVGASMPPPPPLPPPPPRGEKPAPGVHDAPTNPSAKSVELANTHLARNSDLGREDLAIPVEPDGRVHAPVAPAPASAERKSGAMRPINDARPAPVRHIPEVKSGPVRVSAAVTAAPPAAMSGSGEGDAAEAATLETLVEQNKVAEALERYRLLSRKYPGQRAYRAGIELCEGLRALDGRDRLEAAQRFEAALELDPSNERAARELAEMRRQATNERKGLLSRLMGKKETP